MGRRWQAPAVATLSIFAAACLFRERQTLTITALSSTDQQPDILLVVLDDVGHNDVAWGSNATDLAGLTPTLEALARRGVVLDTYYGQMQCAPARAALLSGRFAHRVGFSSNDPLDREVFPYSNYSIPLGVELLPGHLRARGRGVPYGSPANGRIRRVPAGSATRRAAWASGTWATARSGTCPRRAASTASRATSRRGSPIWTTRPTPSATSSTAPAVPRRRPAACVRPDAFPP